MNPQRWEQVQHIFKEMILLDYSTRQTKLNDLNKKDPDLFKEVRSLIDADEDPTSILDGTLSEKVDLTEVFSYEGIRIGPFEIQQKIGSGGMGNVYLAKRVEGGFEQQVALKFIRHGMVSSQLIQRFKAERSILAKLQHPNIARLVDGGFTDEGQPWFAMEFVEGEPIDTYCKKHDLSLNDKLDLFKKINEAIEYAHRNLIIHRDIKPDNILVSGGGKNPQIKLLDFGIAQIVDDIEDSPASGILTKAYASPEQRSGNSTTLSDIYSLGVVMSEIILGTHPVEEFRRGDQASAPIDQELLSVCYKAMDPDPEKRYRTVNDMNNDLNNYQQDRPVNSYSDKPGYTFRKFFRRNRIPVSMGGFSVLLIIMIVLFYTNELKKEKEIAQTEAARSAKVASVLTNSLLSVDPAETPLTDVSAKTFLDKSLSYIGFELSEEPEIRSGLFRNMSRVYASLGVFDVADSLSEISSAYYESVSDTLNEEYVEALSNRADVLTMGGKFEEAEKAITKAVSVANRVMDRKSTKYADVLYDYNNYLYERADYMASDSLLRIIRPVYLKNLGPEDASYQDVIFYMGTNFRKLGMYDSAEVYLKRSLDLSKTYFEAPDEMIASNLNHMSSLYQNMGEYEKALPYAIESYEQRKLIYGEAHINTVASLANTARIYSSTGQYQEAAVSYQTAIQTMQKLYGEDNFNISGLANSLGNVYLKMEDTGKAKEMMIYSIEIGKKNLPEGDIRLAYSYQGMAAALYESNDYEKALEYADKALIIRENILPDQNALLASSRLLSAKCLWQSNRKDEAAPLFAKAKSFYESDPDLYQSYLEDLNGFGF